MLEQPSSCFLTSFQKEKEYHQLCDFGNEYDSSQVLLGLCSFKKETEFVQKKLILEGFYAWASMESVEIL